MFPILNENIYFVGLILKENIDDLVILDENFNINGMSSKLMKIIGIDNKFLFQENEIPFYAICKKFINFYNVFLNIKKDNETPDLDDTLEEANLENDKLKKNKVNKDENKENGINENVQINENVELEYEIKLPQFLIDFSEKTNKKVNNLGAKQSSMHSEVHEGNDNEDQDLLEEFDENVKKILLLNQDFLQIFNRK